MSYGIMRPPVAPALYAKFDLELLSYRFGQCARASGKPGGRSSDGFQGLVALPSQGGHLSFWHKSCRFQRRASQSAGRS